MYTAKCISCPLAVQVGQIRQCPQRVGDIINGHCQFFSSQVHLYMTCWNCRLSGALEVHPEMDVSLQQGAYEDQPELYPGQDTASVATVTTPDAATMSTLNEVRNEGK